MDASASSALVYEPAPSLAWKLFITREPTPPPSNPRVVEALQHLRPAVAQPARSPLPDAFNWHDVAAQLQDQPITWFVVAFRSLRKATADADMLHVADAMAHAEARTSGGLLAYYYGDLEPGGHCLAMCIWQTAAHAHAASKRPLHQRAAALAPAMYDFYRLEIYTASKGAGESRLLLRPHGVAHHG